MSLFSCSFAVHCTSAYVSTRYPDRTQFFPLNSCVSDVKVHLRGLQTTQSCVASERELIVACVGLLKLAVILSRYNYDCVIKKFLLSETAYLSC